MTYSRETARSDAGNNPAREQKPSRAAWTPPSVTRLGIAQTAGGAAHVSDGYNGGVSTSV
jgi:hypothetical protein